MYEEHYFFKNKFLYCFVGLLVGTIFGYVLGKASVCSNTAGNVVVREQISDSQKQQQSITEQSRQAERTTQELNSIIADTGNAISDIEQVLSGVKQRGTKEIK